MATGYQIIDFEHKNITSELAQVNLKTNLYSIIESNKGKVIQLTNLTIDGIERPNTFSNISKTGNENDKYYYDLTYLDTTNNINTIRVYDDNTIKWEVPSGGGSSILRKDGTFVSNEEGTIINTISLSSEEGVKIRNGEINIIYGEYEYDVGSTSYYKVDFNSKIDNMYIYSSTDINDENNETTIVSFQLILNEEMSVLSIIKTTQPSIPTLPSDSSSKTYTLKAVNGVLTWVE